MKYAMLLCASLALVFVGADKATEVQKVRFRLSGAVCGGCASALAETLATSGVEHASKIAPNKGKGAVTVSGDIAEDADLSAIADAILQTETPHKNQAPPALAIITASRKPEAVEPINSPANASLPNTKPTAMGTTTAKAPGRIISRRAPSVLMPTQVR